MNSLHDRNGRTGHRVQERTPLVAVTLAFVTGILVDAYWDVPVWLWITGWLCAVIGSLLPPARIAAAAAALILFVALGGLRHHVSAINSPDQTGLAGSIVEQEHLISGEGVVISEVAVIPKPQDAFSPEWTRMPRSVCNVRLDRLNGTQSVPIDPVRVRMAVSGHLLHVVPGDRVRVIGMPAALAQPSNPGEFDYARYLRGQGVRWMLRVNHPDAVERIAEADQWSVTRLRWVCRERCRNVLAEHLSPRTAVIARSLLLGDRAALTTTDREMFIESGTMHLLAISGLHVGILAMLVLAACHAAGIGVIGRCAVVIAIMVSYMWLADVRPSVVRATVLAVLVVAGVPAHRRPSGLNLLAACGLVVLLISPIDLFDVGAQLSFLAVLGILWSMQALRGWTGRCHTEFESASSVREWVSRGRRYVRSGYVITAAIWLFTLPLVAARFHVIAPIGFVLNVLLIPVVGFALGFGYLTLLLGLLVPEVAAVSAVPLDWLLRFLLKVVEVGSASSLAHVSVAGPDEWWLIAYYLLMVAALVAAYYGRSPRRQRGIWYAAGLLLIVGLTWPLVRPAANRLQTTFISTGHGLAVLIETPPGHTLLYDCGSIRGGRIAGRAVQSVLWSRGITHIDAFIASHADIDHFNGIPTIIDEVPVGRMWTAQSFVDFRQPPVEWLCEAVAERSIPIMFLSRDDRLVMGETEIRVLHPPPDHRLEDDNSSSLVLELTYAGKTIWLTGDVDGIGLTRLLDSATADLAVLQAPHHGSLAANTPLLADRTNPQVVVVSTSDDETDERLQSIYPNSRILSTAEAGAVTVTIEPDGRTSVVPFREVDHTATDL